MFNEDELKDSLNVYNDKIISLKIGQDLLNFPLVSFPCNNNLILTFSRALKS